MYFIYVHRCYTTKKECHAFGVGNFETNECKDNIVDDDVDDDEDYEDDDDLYDWDGCSGNFTKKYNAVNSHTSQVCTHEQMSRDSVKAQLQISLQILHV